MRLASDYVQLFRLKGLKCVFLCMYEGSEVLRASFHLPRHLSMKTRSWTLSRFSSSMWQCVALRAHSPLRQSLVIMDQLPPRLRRMIASSINNGLFSKVHSLHRRSLSLGCFECAPYLRSF